MTTKTIDHIVLDPHLETADTNLENNRFPPTFPEKRIKLQDRGSRWRGGDNPMRKAQKEAEEAQTIEASAEKEEPSKSSD